ncbi:MAG: hypothetical protein LBK42_09025, partial [Propionibacteriaceae bacterium]|nr:hypothetical protein [Propionibacteriaceae bacterium]
TGGPQTATTDVKTAYSYEPRGLLSAVTNPLGGVTSYQYGSDGQLWRETDPVGNTTEYSYDLAGNLVSRERGGVTTSYSHDAAGQLVGRAYSNDSAPETFAYDLAGRQTAATNHSGTVVTSYDLAGQVTSVTDANGRTTAYSYDARGLRVSMTLPDGALTTYTWDAERRNTAMGTSLGRVTFAYDAVGREVSQTRPNGNTVRTAWTADDQIDRLTTTRVVCKKEKVLSDFDYSYDILGNVVALSRTVGTDKTILAYSYDELGRLTASTNSDKQEEDNLYVYDAAGDRVGWTHGTDLSKPTKYVTQTNTYDLAGELVESLDESMPSSTSRQTRLTVNTWQSGDLVRSQTTAERSTLSKGAVKSTRSQWSEDRRFTYDAESRLTSATQWGLKTKKGLTQEIQCGQDTSGDYGCPVGVDRSADPPDHGASQAPARNSLTRQYDALGRAVAQTNGGLETVRWTYDGLDPIYAETTVKKKTTATELIRDAAGRLLGQNTLALKLDGDWFLTDALGSVHAAVSRSGSCLSDKTWYSDWGVQQKENDLLVGYSGELRDPTQNGLVNFYARSYQPEYALWHQPDPFRGLLEIPGSTRAYTYVLLNPITMDELYGYWGFPSIVGAITLAVIGAVAVAAICVGTAGLGCVAAVAAGAFVGGAVGGYIGARVEGASNSSAILFGVKAGTIAAGAVLTGGAAGVGAAGAGGAGLVVAGGGVVGTGASVSASGAMVVVGGGMIAAGGRAEVAYAYGDPGDYGDGTDRQKNGTPKSPKAQNKQAREAIQAAERILKRTLTKSEKQRVHWALKHQNMSFDEIVNVVLQMFS